MVDTILITFFIPLILLVLQILSVPSILSLFKFKHLSSSLNHCSSLFTNTPRFLPASRPSSTAIRVSLYRELFFKCRSKKKRKKSIHLCWYSCSHNSQSPSLLSLNSSISYRRLFKIFMPSLLKDY